MFGIKTIREQIILNLKKAIEIKFGENLLEEKDFELESPPDIKFGDFSWGCFKLAKKIGKKPNEVAEILAKSTEVNDFVEKIIEEGPYLNFYLYKDKWFRLTLTEILEKEDKFGEDELGKDKTILIEFSEPNPNKPMHLGHLRNTLLGAMLSNLFAGLGYKVIRANLINDRGIHIAKSMLAYKLWGEGKTPADEKKKPDYFVGDYYSLFDQKARENPDFLNQAQELLKKWEAGDQETWALWQKMNKWALDGFNETYKKLGVSFDKWYYESETYKLGREMVRDAMNKNLCYQEKDGAVEVDLSAYGLDKKVLIRADGTSIYITQDLGLAKLKYEEYKPDFSLYVVGAEQNHHFQVLFKILEIFGFDWVKNCHHLSYGLVFLPEGKMKSREGRIVEIDNLIHEVKQIAKGEILKREKDILPTELEGRAEKIALASIKFFFLKFTPEEDIHYEPKKEISFEGATGPYLQYTYARIQGIVNKSQILNLKSQISIVDYSVLRQPSEIEVLKLLYNFPEIIKKSALLYNPSYSANFLLELAQKFNTFYHQCPVLQAEEKKAQARLFLIMAVAQVLKNGMKILGIEVLERM